MVLLLYLSKGRPNLEELPLFRDFGPSKFGRSSDELAQAARRDVWPTLLMARPIMRQIAENDSVQLQQSTELHTSVQRL